MAEYKICLEANDESFRVFEMLHRIGALPLPSWISENYFRDIWERSYKDRYEYFIEFNWLLSKFKEPYFFYNSIRYTVAAGDPSQLGRSVLDEIANYYDNDLETIIHKDGLTAIRLRYLDCDELKKIGLFPEDHLPF